jgi:hypothetical protein
MDAPCGWKLARFLACDAVLALRSIRLTFFCREAWDPADGDNVW